MNAKIEVKALDLPAITNLTNALLEEFPDGYMLHADNDFVLPIPRENIVSEEHTDEEDRFYLKDNAHIIIKWA